ncbi:MAG: response regulator, partial [Candidatus Thiodiazotropha sp.]
GLGVGFAAHRFIPESLMVLLLQNLGFSTACIVAQDLTRRGFDIVSFESPWDALLEMHKHGERYYALITDLQMNGMDGVEMVERINKLGRSLSVVLCTGNPSAIEHERAASAGIKNIMHKPIDTHGLADLLTSWMEAEPEDASGA